MSLQKTRKNLLGTTSEQELVTECKDLVQRHRHKIVDLELIVHEHCQASLNKSFHYSDIHRTFKKKKNYN